ncbi:GreA/GreB family elongation factor [Nitrospina watsonii]|uniref:Transcription elongation factor GreA n=1 Tax=Nitrospina watsonii TaxID=1323948 RepID=A0ABN8W0I9_9BACT|nr:GreA/GreB family elongation factor [Nitrospina watsonii]CAI2717934.1 Transcription elongation factor GreA [Nitrospina watsonii]
MRLPIVDKLEKDLMDSKRELEVDIPKALKTATDMGDLSENAEYKAAKERQMFLESRVSQLQKRISDIVSIDIHRIPKDRSGLGSTMLLKDLDSGQEKTFNLVFPEEVNPEEGKISLASPLGKALLGKQEGDDVQLKFGDKQQEFEVLQVTTIHETLNHSGQQDS